MAVLQAQGVVKWVLGMFDEELEKDIVLATSWANTNVVFKFYLQQSHCRGGKSCQGCSDHPHSHSCLSLHPFCAIFSQSLW